MNRRNVLKQSALCVAALAAGGNIFNSLPSNEESKSLKNNINHSV